METIMITEEQKDNIVKELARLKKIFEKDGDIDCVYFSFFLLIQERVAQHYQLLW